MSFNLNLALVPYTPPRQALIPYKSPLTTMKFIASEYLKKILRDSSMSTEKFSIDSINSKKEISINKIFSKLSKLSKLSPFVCESKVHFQPLSDTFTNLKINNTNCVESYQKLDGDKITEALQSEAAFTIATDKKPIVVTYGCKPCVALGGYDETNKIAFIVHFSNLNEVRGSWRLIFYNIEKLVKTKIEKPIQLHLRGGIKGQSEGIIEAIKIMINQRQDLPMEIASEDILGDGFGSKSLLIDSRNGEVSKYDPLSNAQRRDFDTSNVLFAMSNAYDSALSGSMHNSGDMKYPIVRLAYAPTTE